MVVASAAIVEGTREIVRLRGAEASLTAKDVRLELEQRLGQPRDGLLAQREEIVDAISLAMTELQPQAAAEVDAETVRQAVEKLEGDGSSQARAQLMASASAGKNEALVLLSEASAQSEAVACSLVEAGIGRCMMPLLSRDAPKDHVTLALRLLSAVSSHSAAGVSEALLRDGVLPLLLAILQTAAEALALRAAALLGSLADSKASRFRLVHGGALRCLARVMVEPVSSGSLKELGLQAATAVAGRADDEVSLPQLLGDLCADRVPGTQREAISALLIVAEKQPSARGRLLQVEEVLRGLQVASSSTDTQVTHDARELQELLAQT